MRSERVSFLCLFTDFTVHKKSRDKPKRMLGLLNLGSYIKRRRYYKLLQSELSEALKGAVTGRSIPSLQVLQSLKGV